MYQLNAHTGTAARCTHRRGGAGIRDALTVTGGAAKGTDANADLADAARRYAR